MIGILLTVLAVLLVICLAFRYSDQGTRNPARDFPFLHKGTSKKKG